MHAPAAALAWADGGRTKEKYLVGPGMPLKQEPLSKKEFHYWDRASRVHQHHTFMVDVSKKDVTTGEGTLLPLSSFPRPSSFRRPPLPPILPVCPLPPFPLFHLSLYSLSTLCLSLSIYLSSLSHSHTSLLFQSFRPPILA